MRHKYPRTYHLPWSEGATDDDKTLTDLSAFVGREVVVTEKLDGENTSMYTDYIHARSLDSKHHPSRNWIKAFHGSIAHDIPKGYRVCGENMYAKHSIHYEGLNSYFYVFAIYNENNVCLSWDETLEMAEILGVQVVPQIWRGIWDEDRVKKCFYGTSLHNGIKNEQEGYVVRITDSFSYDDHVLAKFVRQNHVQTSSHWMSEEIVPNILN